MAAEGIYYSAGAVQKFYHLIGKLITSDPSRWEMSTQPSSSKAAVVTAVIYVVEPLCQGDGFLFIWTSALSRQSFQSWESLKTRLSRAGRSPLCSDGAPVPSRTCSHSPRFLSQPSSSTSVTAASSAPSCSQTTTWSPSCCLESR